MMKSNSRELIVVALSFCVFLVACLSNPPASNPSMIYPKAEDTVGRISGSFITITSKAKLITEASLIVLATVVKEDHIINAARDVKDPSQPAKDVYGVTQIYQIKIDKVLKGNEADTILVAQVEGFLASGETKSEENILKSKERYDYIPMAPGRNYLMFLRSMSSYPEEKLYTGNANPWRFDASDPNKVVPESPWTFASYYFPPQTLDQFIEEIQHPEKIVEYTPYPPPQSMGESRAAYPPPQKPKQ